MDKNDELLIYSLEINETWFRNDNIIDSANAVALAVKTLLTEKKLLRTSGKATYKFYVSDGPEKFKNIGSKFLGKKILTVKKVEID